MDRFCRPVESPGPAGTGQIGRCAAGISSRIELHLRDRSREAGVRALEVSRQRVSRVSMQYQAVDLVDYL
jgi:hypothetical protein